MRKETRNWMKYSEENLEASKVLIESGLYNPCLQNIQQSVEKALKALFIENAIKFKKTHNILELKIILENKALSIDLTEDECDFLDSIYLPSKYPIGSALPFFQPDEKICKEAISLVERVIEDIKKMIN